MAVAEQGESSVPLAKPRVRTGASLLRLWEVGVGASALALLLAIAPGGPDSAQSTLSSLVLHSADSEFHLRPSGITLALTPNASDRQGFRFSLVGNELERQRPSVHLDLFFDSSENEAIPNRRLALVANNDFAGAAVLQTSGTANTQYFHLVATAKQDSVAQLGKGARHLGGLRLQTARFVGGWLSLIDVETQETLLRPAPSSSPNPLRIRIPDEDGGFRDPKVTP